MKDSSEVLRKLLRKSLALLETEFIFADAFAIVQNILDKSIQGFLLPVFSTFKTTFQSEFECLSILNANITTSRRTFFLVGVTYLNI